MAHSKSGGRFFMWDASLHRWVIVSDPDTYAGMEDCRLIEERALRRELGSALTRPLTTTQLLRLLRREDAELTEHGHLTAPFLAALRTEGE